MQKYLALVTQWKCLAVKLDGRDFDRHSEKFIILFPSSNKFCCEVNTNIIL